jgi:hypothetical protein
MGSSSSKDDKKQIGGGADDVYDYLLVFPDSRDDAGACAERISYADALENLQGAVSGEKDMDKMQERLETRWMHRFQLPSKPTRIDTISIPNWEGIARDIFIDMLTKHCKLQCKLSRSADGDEIYCQVRAPVKQLEKFAEETEYGLSFRSEIDPGVEWWHENENFKDADERTLTQKQAEQELEELFADGAIGPEEVKVFTGEENARMWSNRVAAWQRITATIETKNPYPNYAPFNDNGPTRHLFQTYNDVREPCVFKTLDRIKVGPYRQFFADLPLWLPL